MPSDALTQNLGRLNNSIEKLFPLLNAVVVNSKESSQKGSKKEGAQKLDNAVKAMSSGMFMSIIIDNASSKELVKANDSMKNLISTAGGMDKAAIESFKNNIVSLTNTINSINIGNAKAIRNLNNYILVLQSFIYHVNSLNNSKISSSTKELDNFGKSLNKFIDIINSFDKLNKVNTDLLIKAKLLNSIISVFSKNKNINVKSINKLSELKLDFKELNKLSKLTISENNIKLFSRIINELSNIDGINYKNINKLSDLKLDFKELNKLSKLNISLDNIKTFSKIIDELSNVKSLNIKSINKLSDIKLDFKELNKLSKLNISLDNIKTFSKIIDELTKVKKLNVKSINKLSDIDFKEIIKQINSLTRIKPESKAGVALLNSIIISLAQVNKIDARKIHRVFKDLSDLNFKDIIKGFAELNKITPNTKKGLDEFIKIISSLDELDNIHVNKSIRKLRRLFKGLNDITLSLTAGKKKINVVQISGLADFINAAKTAEKINVSKATRKINRLDEFFKKLNDIVNETILGKDSPFADKSKRKELDDTIKLINKFMDSNKVMMKAMALNALLGIPALIGFGFSWLVYKGLIKLLNKLSDVKIDKNTNDAIKNLSLFALSMAGVLGIMVVAAKIYESTDPGSVWATFGLLAATAVLFGSIAVLAKKFGTEEIQGAKSLGIFALITVGVTGSIILLSKLIQGTAVDAILGTVMLMAGVALGLYGISKLTNKIESKDIQGMYTIGIMAALMVGVTTSIVLIARQYSELGPGPIWATLGLMAATAVMLVGVGFATSALMKTGGTSAIAGAAATAIMALTMIGTTYAIIKLSDDVNKIGFGNLMKTLGVMTIVVATMIGLGAALGYAMVITGPAIIGALSLAAITAAMTYSLNGVIDMHNMIKDNKEVFELKTINGKQQIAALATVTPIVKSILELGESIGETTLSSYIKTKRTLKLVNKLIKTADNMLDVIIKFDNSKISNEEIVKAAFNIGSSITIFMNMTLQTMAQVETTTNKTIRKTRRTFRAVNQLLNLSNKLLNIILKYSPNNKTGGKDVIKLAALSSGTISEALMSFIGGFDIKAASERTNRENKRLRKTLKNIERLVNIVPTFLDSIKKAEDLTKNKTDIKGISDNIANAVKKFSTKVFGAFEESGDPKKIRKQIKNFKNIIKPITGFVDMITSVQSSGEGKLGKLRFDENGNILEVKEVDVNTISSTIAGAVTKFLENLYSTENIEKWKNVSGSTNRKIGKLLKVIDPINSFIDLLSKYDVKDGKLEVLDFNKLDANGNATPIKSVNISEVTTNLSGVITDFMDNFYSDSNIEKWNTISGKKIRKANAKIGKLTQIIEPISSFVDMLSTFSSNTSLFVIDPETGKVFKKVEISDVASNIAGCISAFLNGLYSHESEWSQISGVNILKEAGGAVIQGLKDINTNRRLGKFGTILDPINTFMTLVTSYKWDGTSLMVPNGDGTERKIDFAATGSNIAQAIKSFTDSVYKSEGDIKSNSNVILEVGNNFTESFKKIDETLEKSKNDKRIKELQRLSKEFENLSKNIDKMVKSSEKVTNAINTNNSNNSTTSINTPKVEGYKENSTVNNTKADKGNVDFDKLALSIQNAINTGIQDAFKNQYKFKANCTYDKSMQEFVITRQ